VINLHIRRLRCYRETITEDQIIDFHLVGMLMQGNTRAWVNGNLVSCATPRAYITAAGDHRRLESVGERTAWGFSFFSPDIRRNTAGSIQLRDEDRWIDIPEIVALDQPAVRMWAALFEDMHTLLQSPDLISHFKAKAMLLKLISLLLAERRPDSASPAAALKDLIDSDMAWDRNLQDLCAECGYSASRLRDLFRREFGIAPKTYLNRRRMDRAFDLITNSTATVTDIAQQLGFRHVSHFSANFKQAHGVSATEAIDHYRQHG